MGLATFDHSENDIEGPFGMENLDAEVLVKIGYLEGKINSLEQWKVSYEAKIDKRLHEIQESLDGILTAVNKGLGVKWLGGILIAGLLGLPLFITSVVQVYDLFHTYMMHN